MVLDLKRLHKQGKLTPYQKQFWFGTRPEEELYLMEKDPHQINNLATDPQFQEELLRHRAVLEEWIASTGDKGQFRRIWCNSGATYDLWKDRKSFRKAKVNPEYDAFKNEANEAEKESFHFYLTADDVPELGKIAPVGN